MKDDYAIVKRLKSGETVPAGAVPADLIRTAAGEIHVSTANGPKELVHAANINTVLSAAGGAGWEKAQATTANYAIVRPTSGASLDLHVEVGGTLAALAVANWPIPSSGVDQLRIRNMSAIAQTFSATGFSGIVTADGNAATSGSYSIPVDMAVHVTIDEDGWIQVSPMGQEVSQAEMDAVVSSLTNGTINAVFKTLKAEGAIILPASTDLNTVIESGVYNGSGFSNGPLPVDLNQWYYLEVIRHRSTNGAVNNTYIAQKLTRLEAAGSAFYIRTNVAGTWSAWREVASTDNPAFKSATPSTPSTTIATTDTALRVRRAGTPSTKYDNALDINIGSHTAGMNAQTQVDFRVNNGGTNTPDTTILSLRGNGEALVAGTLIPTSADLALKAPLASPVLTGTPTAPTAAVATNTPQIATTAFVQAATAALVGASPATLDTLNELAAALGDDPNYAATITTALGLKAPLSSPALTDTPTAPTPAVDTNTTQVATTAFVNSQLSGTLPVMNGTATVGSGNRSCRGNHVHPVDTSRAAATALTDSSVDMRARTVATPAVEYDAAATYKSATFSIGDNQAVGDTILQIINADTGATSTLTIPTAIDESSDLAAGKVSLSADFAIAATQSMIIACLSGGPFINLELRLQ